VVKVIGEVLNEWKSVDFTVPVKWSYSCFKAKVSQYSVDNRSKPLVHLQKNDMSSEVNNRSTEFITSCFGAKSLAFIDLLYSLTELKAWKVSSIQKIGWLMKDSPVA